MEQKDLKYLFDNIKDGDALFFYHKQWWAFFSKIIALFTGDKVDHVGVILSVVKIQEGVIFNFSEQTFTMGGKFDPFSIIKSLDKYVLKGFSADKIYYGKLKKDLTQDQIKIMYDDAISQIGVKYGTGTLLKTLNWYSNLFTKKQTAVEQLRVCSTHAQIMYEKASVLNGKNEKNGGNFFSPAELISSEIFTVYEIIDF